MIPDMDRADRRIQESMETALAVSGFPGGVNAPGT